MQIRFKAEQSCGIIKKTEKEIDRVRYHITVKIVKKEQYDLRSISHTPKVIANQIYNRSVSERRWARFR